MPLSRPNARLLLLTFAGWSVFAGAAPLGATTFVPQSMVCPIGGETFEAEVIASNSYFGQRPDGMPYSPMPVIPVPECPGNGLILFQDEFSREELNLLTEAIAHPEFAVLREEHAQFYRIAWLQQRIGADSYDRATSLMIAGWQADGNADLKRQYQREFVAAASALDTLAGQEDAWFWLNLRAANALRELGRFDEAAALLLQLESSSALPQAEDERESALGLIQGLGRLVGEANPYPEPTNLIPPEMAAERCLAVNAALSAAERTACASDEVQEAISERRDFERERDETVAEDTFGNAASAVAEAAMSDVEALLETADNDISERTE